MNLQLPRSQKEKKLHKKFGHDGLVMIYGAGCIKAPDLMLIFMNPTSRNIASSPDWSGIRAPWIGVKKVWQMLASLELIDPSFIPEIWNENSAKDLYGHVAERKLHITNLASCTQPDARPLQNIVFRDYLPLIKDEIGQITPKIIVTFGNQVSSILLQKSVAVSSYQDIEYETLIVDGKTFTVYPTYYPVGQGQRNMPKAVERIRLLTQKR